MSDTKQLFSELYDKHVEKIYRFIFIKVDSQETAEDLTSETFTRAWKSFKKDGKIIFNPPAFFYQIARNLVTDYYRQKGRTKLVPAENVQLPDPNNDFEYKAVFSADVDLIKQAISNLKDSYQEVIAWHYLDDLSVPEIAKIIKKPEGTVRVNIHRALEALKRELGGMREV